MRSASAVIRSVSSQAHMQALGNLDKLFALAIRAETRDGNKDGDAGRIKAIHHFSVPMPLDGEVLMVRIMAKELADQNQGNRLYLVQALEIETPASKKGESDSSVEGRSPHLPAGVDERLRRMVAAVKGEGVSKVVDPETGEPMVVYHGTRKDFDVFRTGKDGGIPIGTVEQANSPPPKLSGLNIMPLLHVSTMRPLSVIR